MSTTIRPEISPKNEYWIDRHRYYELKHLCLQYKLLKKVYNEIDGYAESTIKEKVDSSALSNVTEKIGLAKASIKFRTDIIDQAIDRLDPEAAPYIFKGVTEGLSYEVIRVRTGSTISKDYYYEQYRKFFYILSQLRN